MPYPFPDSAYKLTTGDAPPERPGVFASARLSPVSTDESALNSTPVLSRSAAKGRFNAFDEGTRLIIRAEDGSEATAYVIGGSITPTIDDSEDDVDASGSAVLPSDPNEGYSEPGSSYDPFTYETSAPSVPDEVTSDSSPGWTDEQSIEPTYVPEESFSETAPPSDPTPVSTDDGATVVDDYWYEDRYVPPPPPEESDQWEWY